MWLLSQRVLGRQLGTWCRMGNDETFLERASGRRLEGNLLSRGKFSPEPVVTSGSKH